MLPRLACGYPGAVVMLAAHFLIAAASVREKSNTYDENKHVAAGFSYWTRNDYRLQPENGVLPQRWFALPLLTLDLKFPEDQAAWTASDVWTIGDRFFFESRNNVEELLWRARCMNVVISVGLGFLVYAWSRRLFGPGGGMISLLAYATSPTILANGSLATSDLAAAAFFTLSVGCLWKMFHKLSPATLVCCWLALAGLFLSKMSALLIVPMGLALLAVRLVGRCPLTVSWTSGVVVDRRFLRAGILLGVMLLQAVFVVVTIWAFYGFRYSAFQEPLVGNEHFFYGGWSEILAGTGAPGRVAEFVRNNRLLPEAYVYGTACTYSLAQVWPAFLNGQYSRTGWWYFFPYTVLVKTPLSLFLLLILAGTGAIAGWRQVPPGHWRALGQSVWRAFYATAPLWILLIVYWATALNTKLNIGHRHILPTYPAMLILAGAASRWFREHGHLRWIMSAAVLLCVFLLAGECLATYPHYLAYFNWITGGPGNGYKHLVDSSLDWGQDLPGLKQWLKEHDLDSAGKTPVYLAYFGRAEPAYYHIRATELCGPRPRPLVPLTAGVYCISATELQQVYSLTSGRWCQDYEKTYQKTLWAIHRLETAGSAARSEIIRSKGEPFWNQVFSIFNALRLGRLCAFLRQGKPDDNIGYSILIYRLTRQDIQEALFGPPAELFPTEIQPDFAEAHNTLGIALAAGGRLDEAIAHFRKALEISPDFTEAINDLAWQLATCPEASLRNGAEAVELARRAEQLTGGRQAEVLDTLAAAYAAAGRFQEAVATARKALELATKQNQQALADELKNRIALYEAGRPFFQTGGRPSHD